MKFLAFFVIVLIAHQGASAQMIPLPPVGGAAYSDCALYPVLPSNFTVRYRIPNARLNNQEGTVKITYMAPHVWEGQTGGVNYIGRFSSTDVDVEEEFNDMGTWIMRQNNFRTRWLGECYISVLQVKFVRAIDVLGNLQQIEPPTCPDGSFPQNGQCPPNDPQTGPAVSGGGGLEEPCGPEVFFCPCWELVAWFQWVDGVWTQISDPWWENVCTVAAGSPSSDRAVRRSEQTPTMMIFHGGLRAAFACRAARKAGESHVETLPPVTRA